MDIVFDKLRRSYINKRLSHAYLFYGEQGTQKKETAIKFAQMLYCENEDPCQLCVNCRSIKAGAHQNVVTINPDGQNIKKEQIVSMIKDLSMTSLVNGPRIYIINEADKLSESSSNSLLKFIEEPSDGIYVILITDNISLILPTIRSRCQQLMFSRLSRDEYLKLIAPLVPEKYLSVLAEVTNSVEEVNNLLPDFDQMADAVRDVVSKKGLDAILSFDKVTDFLQQKKEYLPLFVRLLFLLYLDAILYLKGYETLSKYANDEIKQLSLFSEKDILKKAQLIIECMNKLRYNVNAYYTVRQMILSLEMRS